MKKLLFLIAFFSSLAFAEGPIYRHKDPATNQEFQNVYQDIRTTNNSNKFVKNSTTTQTATFYVTSGTVQATFTASTVVASGFFFKNDTDTYCDSPSAGTIRCFADGVPIAVFTSTSATVNKYFTAVGETSNASASTGFIGEHQESVVSTLTNYPTTTEYGDCTSLSLTAGDWAVTMTLEADKGASTWSQTEIGISATTGNSTSGLVIGSTRLRHNYASSSTTPDRFPMALPNVRVSLSATTVYYAKVSASYSAGTPQYRCRLSARRTR